jgi:hypothetical protein
MLIVGALHCVGTNSPACPLLGDVDGDGHADAVWIARRRTCSFDLVVRTRVRRLEAEIPEPFCAAKPSEFWTAGFPRVIALRPMNAHHGLEPEVLLWSGASNDAVRFFTVWRGRLRPMRIRPEPYPKDEWNLGGFVEAYAYTNCVRPHLIRRAGASFDSRRWPTETEEYEATAAAFVRVEHRSWRARRDPTERLSSWVKGDYFRDCGGVVRGPGPP